MERLKILFLSHTYIGGSFVVGSHHLSEQLAARGHKVVHIATPITLYHLIGKYNINQKKRIEIFKKGSVVSGVENIVPFTLFPWKISRNIYKLTGINLLQKTLTNKSKMFNEVYDILIIDQPQFVGIEKKIKSKKIIYRATDLYAVMKNDEILTLAESDISAKSDGIIGTSNPVVKHLKKFTNAPSLVLENGVNIEHFTKRVNKPKEYINLEGAIATYVGALDFRFDFLALIKLSRSLPNLNFIIIGPISKEINEELHGIKNVFFLGERKFEEIPAYLQYSDLGLLLTNDHPSNNGRSPMKLYEYACSGLPVLLRETEELEKLSDDFLFFYKDNSNLVTSAINALNHNLEKKDIIESGTEKSWSIKTQILMDFIDEL